jgi:chaperone protein EcpD
MKASSLRKFSHKGRSVSVVLFALASMALGVATANAAVAIQGTRVIYSEKDREQIVRLTNRTEKPALIQNWIDAGNPDLAAGSQDVPFLLTPPMVRIEGNQGQTLRLIYVPEMGAQIPRDRESIYYLNMLEIPPKRDTQGQNVLQLAVRTRIKLFFRPEGVQGDPRDARLADRTPRRDRRREPSESGTHPGHRHR